MQKESVLEILEKTNMQKELVLEILEKTKYTERTSIRNTGENKYAERTSIRNIRENKYAERTSIRNIGENKNIQKESVLEILEKTNMQKELMKEPVLVSITRLPAGKAVHSFIVDWILAFSYIELQCMAKSEVLKAIPFEPPNQTDVEDSIKKIKDNDSSLKHLNLNNIKVGKIKFDKFYDDRTDVF
ncbi:uncharacterized protein LOC128551309 [Mercenaria mercenaria]|uniref:uncharacterized protein LOC128551309 n=1 Tax=Mercenaria mercenaria TaxID=6596 RepID=UPI00234FADE3|nr:uncharacterized protein LOC128551309 [Mercenaria mercenaria]